MLFSYGLSVVVAVFKVQVTFSVLSFEASSNFVEKGLPFTLTCHVSPLTGIVQFLRNGSVVGSCSVPSPPFAPGVCSPATMAQVLASENTTLTISSASFSTNNGTWKCEHTTETGETFVVITELAKNITNNDASLPATPGIETAYEVYVDCSYPKIEIKWKLQECGGANNIDVITNPNVIEEPGTCIYPAQKYSSKIKVSDMANQGRDPKCYTPFATLYYSFASSAAIQKHSNISFILPGLTTTVSTESTSSNSITIETSTLSRCNWECQIGIIVPIIAAVIVLIVIIICCVRHKCIKTNETKTKNSTDLTSF